jgi:hypothetical protein
VNPKVFPGFFRIFCGSLSAVTAGEGPVFSFCIKAFLQKARKIFGKIQQKIFFIFIVNGKISPVGDFALTLHSTQMIGLSQGPKTFVCCIRKARGENAMKKIKAPDLIVFTFAMMVLAMILTWVVPAGHYERYFNEELNRTLVDPNSYTMMEQTPVGIGTLLAAIPQGIVNNILCYITPADYEAAKKYVANPEDYDFMKILNW